jgi:hypothetical protein
MAESGEPKTTKEVVKKIVEDTAKKEPTTIVGHILNPKKES